MAGLDDVGPLLLEDALMRLDMIRSAARGVLSKIVEQRLRPMPDAVALATTGIEEITLMFAAIANGDTTLLDEMAKKA